MITRQILRHSARATKTPQSAFSTSDKIRTRHFVLELFLDNDAIKKKDINLAEIEPTVQQMNAFRNGENQIVYSGIANEETPLFFFEAVNQVGPFDFMMSVLLQD